MHMNIAMTLRLMITPVTPIVNSTAESARYHESCGSITFILALTGHAAGRRRAVALLRQSCLLLSPACLHGRLLSRRAIAAVALRRESHARSGKAFHRAVQASRSEERRVGKGGR